MHDLPYLAMVLLPGAVYVLLGHVRAVERRAARSVFAGRQAYGPPVDPVPAGWPGWSVAAGEETRDVRGPC